MHETYPDNLVIVTYHYGSSDPFYNYNQTENRDRFFFYPPHPDGNYYTPYAWIDGIIRGAYNYNSWSNMFYSRASDESPIEITFSGRYNEDNRTGTVDIKLIAHDEITQEGLHLRVALIEDSLYYVAPNGTIWHNYTMRDMIPRSVGTPISLQQGDTLVSSQGFTCLNPLVAEKCSIVAWVQADNSGKEVLQTGIVKVTDLNAVSVDEPENLPLDFQLAQNYPNPFNATTSINYSLKRDSMVKLEVYNISGAKVVTLVNNNQPAGNYQVIWDGRDSQGKVVATGVYFYRLSADGQSLTRRMTLLK